MTANAKHDDEAGLGLIELIVAVVVSGIILIAVVMIFINSWRAQEQVTSVTEATNRGQLIGSTIERAMRNALYFDVSESGTVLRVSTSLGGELRCQGFRLTDGPAPGVAQWTSSSGTLPVDSSTWPEWQTNVAQQGSTAFFVQTIDDTLTYTFRIMTDASPVNLSGEVAPRSTQATGSDGCW